MSYYREQSTLLMEALVSITHVNQVYLIGMLGYNVPTLDAGRLHSPQVTWRSEDYNTKNVTIILEWMQEPGVSYNVSVIPSTLTESRITGNTHQLTILYNTSYGVVVLATLCGLNMNMTVINISVNYTGELYSKCYYYNIYFIIIFDLHGVRAQPNAERVHQFMMHVIQNCLITGFLVVDIQKLEFLMFSEHKLITHYLLLTHN